MPIKLNFWDTSKEKSFLKKPIRNAPFHVNINNVIKFKFSPINDGEIKG